MKTLELLAPAKNIECGIAAIDHGADAVYIGAPRFGARASAGNSIDDIAELCRHAHRYGARVFVTVNTIIYDDELEDILRMIHELDSIGVDALLIQDMGLMTLLRKEKLHCQLHASTQTDNRNAEKVRWLSNLGFKRVVLARELSIEEISKIHSEVPETELEVFVHGALCVSYSGQCYASQYCFHRSANRGECAQFCRLAFTLKDADGHILEENRHLLSLRDMAQLDNLEQLAEAGAVSFKIEGRLKDVDYVKNVTAAYSEALNAIVAKHPDKYRRASYGKCKYTFTPNIAKSFNRGFTSYFAHGRQQNMVSFYTPKSMGEYVGKVKEIRGHSFNIATTASFSNGDGLCYLDDNHQLVGFRVNKVEGNRIFPLRLPASLKPGTMLFRNLDQAFTTLLSKPSAERRIPINLSLSTTESEIHLHGKDECGRENTISEMCELQKAQKPQTDNIIKQLSKLGGTIYEAASINIDTEDFIPSSLLSSLRRRLIESLEEQGYDNSHPLQKEEKDSPSIPYYQLSYLYNASNKNAISFYKEQGINASAFETHASDGPLMQCRYCLRFEMGYCTKSGRKAPWKEPLTISISDGRTFRLNFDCKKCQMNVMTIE